MLSIRTNFVVILANPTQSVTEQSHIMELQIEGSSYPIPEGWVQRWQLLMDYREENGNLLKWTYTPPAEVLQWIELNKKLDEGAKELKTTKANFSTGEYEVFRPSEAYHDPIPISSIYNTLQYMNAVNGEYLLGCYIDETLSFSVRKQMYKDLGRYIREKELVFSYRLVTAEYYGTHQNAGLLLDPAMRGRVIGRHEDLFIDRYYSDETTREADMQKEYEEALAYPFDILVGIIHTAAQRQTEVLNVKTIERPDASKWKLTTWRLPEVPWWLVRWDDVRTMHFTEETKNLVNAIKDKRPNHGEVLRILTNMSYIVAIFCGASEESKDARLGGDVTVVEMTSDPVSKVSFGDRMTLPSVFGDVDSYLTVYSKQATVVSDELVKKLSVQRHFGLERLLARDISSIYTVSYQQEGRRIPHQVNLDIYSARGKNGIRQVEDMAATEVIGVWMIHQIDKQYKKVVPIADYKKLMKSLLTATNRDFIMGIVTLLIRMAEVGVTSNKWSNVEVDALAEACLEALEE